MTNNKRKYTRIRIEHLTIELESFIASSTTEEQQKTATIPDCYFDEMDNLEGYWN